MLLVRGWNITRALEQDPRRVSLAESATQSKFEIFKAFDRLGAKVRGRPRVFEDVRVSKLAQSLDRAIQLGGRHSLLRQLATERLRVIQPLLCLATELLRILGRQTSGVALRSTTTRGAAAAGRSTIGHLLPVAAALTLSLTVRL